MNEKKPVSAGVLRKALSAVTNRLDDLAKVKKGLILASSTEGSTKKFKIAVSDDGTLTATEVTE